MAATIEIKKLDEPDEIRDLPKTHIEIVNINETTIMRATFQPGWKWSECVKTAVNTKSCQVSHLNYVISGKMMIAMDDGTQKEMGAGDFAEIPPGHDAWVIGNEPCVLIDFSGGRTYGKNN